MKHATLVFILQAVSLTWIPSPTPNATTSVFRDGTQITSGLTAAAYTDAAVLPGSSYSYTVKAVAGGAVSAPSNAVVVLIPVSLTPTTVTASASVISGLMSKVTVKVATAAGPVTGNVVWSFQGSVVYTTGLNKQGQASEQIPTLLLKFIPLNLQYQGSAKFAPSTGTFQ